MFGSGHETQWIEIISEGLLLFQKLESFTTSKMDCHLLCQKLRQRREVRNQFSGNLSVFVFIIEIFWQYKWRFIFDGVKNSSWSNSIYFLNSNNMFLWIVFIHFVKIWWYLRNKFNTKCEKQASNVFNFSHDWAPLFFKI